MYQLYYAKTHILRGEDFLEVNNKDTDSFAFSFNPIEGLFSDENQFGKGLDFSDLDSTHENLSDDN